MKWVKWGLIGLGAVVLLFAGALAFIAATFDPNQHKAQVEALVKEKTQRTLTIEGDVRLMLFPKLGVQLGKTRLSEFNNDKEFAGIDTMRVSLALMPLLARQVVVDQIQIDGLRASLVKHKDGKTNFDDLLGTRESTRKATAPASETQSPASTPIKFDINGVKVSKVALSWKDEATGAEYVISDLALETGRVAPGVPVQFDLSAGFSISKPKLDLKLQGSGSVSADPKGQSFSVPVLTTSVTIKGPQLEGTLDIKLAGLDGSAKAMRIGEFVLTVDARQADQVFKGSLSTPIAADFIAQVFDFPKLAGEFDLTSPALPMKSLKVPLAGSVRADLKSQTANVDLVTRFDESNIKIKYVLSDFAAPFSRFDIAIDKLNVDRYLPPAPKKTQTSGPSSPAPAEQPIDFSPIKALNLAGSLRIDELIASNVKTQNLRMDVTANGGRLVINPVSADLYQGHLKGSASVDANSNRMAIKQNLAGIMIGPLLRDATGQDLMEGRGNVAFDVVTTGKLVSAMKKALSGTAKVDLRDGAIKGLDLAKILRDAKALAGGGKREAEQGAAAGEQTVFSELSASFDIRNGIAHNGDFLAKSPVLRLTGEGDINLPDSALNYVVKIAATRSGAGQEGKNLDEVKGSSLPVRVYGPFAALKYKIELGSVLSDSAKQKLDEKKDEIKDKLEDKLKSKLFGKTDEPAAPQAGGQAGQTPPATQEDKLKDKLKKLF